MSETGTVLSDLDRPEVFVASAANEDRTDCMIICDEVDAVSIAATDAGVIFDDWPDFVLSFVSVIVVAETKLGAAIVGFDV